MKIDILMEYRCGHPVVTIVSGQVNPPRIGKGIEKLVAKVPKRADGKIECRCPKCNRGAGWVTIKADGVTISRSSVDDEVRSGHLQGADLSVGPDQESN